MYTTVVLCDNYSSDVSAVAVMTLESIDTLRISLLFFLFFFFYFVKMLKKSLSNLNQMIAAHVDAFMAEETITLTTDS